jgi:hypothetical protein
MKALYKLATSLDGLTTFEMFKQALSNDEFRQELVRILIQDQLEQGIDGDGKELPEYSEISVNVYGKEAGPYKLYDTGEFYKSITIEKIDGSGIVIYGDTDKGRVDLMMYSESILYLNNDSLNELKPTILMKFREYLLTKMLKKS